MIFSIEKPFILVAVLIIIPTVLYILYRFKKLSNSVIGFYKTEKEKKAFRKLKLSLWLRTAFRCFAWIFAVLAYAGISWGTKNIPIQKNGCSVCLVFDISYSMLAPDSMNGKTRLEAAELFAENLLSRLENTTFSVVLTKGDGFIAVPATEDFSSIVSLLHNLSPNLMTSAGTSLGKGIETAINSFPSNSARTNFIWVFTDGDETDNQLEDALNNSVKFGIPVTLVGFGSEKGTEIIAGDGITKVMTKLQSDKMKKLIAACNKNDQIKFSKNKFSEKQKNLKYVSASDTGSAYVLLNQIEEAENPGSDDSPFAYETVEIKRHGLFLFLALLSFVLSFIAGELRLKKNAVLTLSIVFLALTSTSCKFDKKAILRGSWNWYQGNFKTATADFLNASYDFSDKEVVNAFAVFGLAATYISLEEYEAALDRLNQLNLNPEKIPSNLISAAYYNYGIIYERKNNFSTASDYFKKAILADSSNLNAKINLELCNRQAAEKQALSGEAEMQGVSENNSDSSLKNELFNLIRENDNNQWKKLQSNPQENSVLDY